jgi:hypothetical protein
MINYTNAETLTHLTIRFADTRLRLFAREFNSTTEERIADIGVPNTSTLCADEDDSWATHLFERRQTFITRTAVHLPVESQGTDAIS